MNVSRANNANVYTDLSGLTRLRADARQNSPEALKAAAQQFEALFVQMMLKSMREAGNASGGDALFGSDQQELYQDMYDKQISLELAKGRGIGLADMLVRQLEGSVARTELPREALERQTFDVRRQRVAASQLPAAAAEAPASTQEPTGFASPDDFVRALWPHAQHAADKLGVDPRALIAQAALETGWGKAVIRMPDGGSSHNLFNIKADHRWDGPHVFKDTLEYRDGIAAKERAPFRAYDSYAASFDDYVNFLQSNARYRGALEQAADPVVFVRELQRAGYATDPAYARKIQDIMGRDLLASVAPDQRTNESVGRGVDGQSPEQAA
jgi:flagellar protein FlgJ